MGCRKTATGSMRGPGTSPAFLGRISPEKGVDRAIATAKWVGMALKISAKIDNVDRAYSAEVVVPLLQHPLVTYLGEIDDSEKGDFLGNAYALLFPIDWPEPIGLLMIEAMVCGTPVIAYRHGSVPEIMQYGVTGFIIDDMEEAILATERVPTLHRVHCHQWFEQHFSAQGMAKDYVTIYQRLIDRQPKLSYAM